ncbi:hypothetical protein C8C83_4697 [Flavobacterium sp. 90]|uniref:hypothetical protein n=1 Tax=unclassified Flavobacterium TaxID=196869 RepID=UPI000F29E939|nr:MULTISPECIES: hypothetical protein [unclassified Flavobacterium]RKR05351.1 hypothetical protein C8C82_5039 [Flavobacterium sp. 81]TCK56666.1 hypothetical protein C8C83_4697 [Flavobacterium sp. 90]
MKKSILLLVLATTLFSCKQENKATPDSVKNDQSKKNDKNVYSKYEYTDSNGGSVTIQNSFPKGGMRYKDSKGDEYVYAVFWTKISNETDYPLEVNIDFPQDSFEIPSVPDKYFKILIPKDTMTLEKMPLFNYGLTDLDSFFDKNIDKLSSLKKTINPKESSAFYIVTLRLLKGVEGVLRTELSLKGQILYYKINDKEIQCGNINLKNLTLKK